MNDKELLDNTTEAYSSMSEEEPPEGWEFSTLGEVTLKKVEQVKREGPLTYIDIGSIDNSTKSVTEPQELANTDKIPSRARQLVESDDIIVSMTRPNLNAVAKVSKQRDGAIASTGFDVLRSIEVEPDWIFSIVKSREFVSSMSGIVQGALYPAVRPNDIRSYRIPVPPKAEQKRIVTAIESLQERSSRTRALLEEVKPLIGELRQSVLRSAFSGRLTADWRAKQNTRDLKGKEEGQGTSTDAKAGATRKPIAQKTDNAGSSPQSTETKFETATELLQRIRIERRKKWETAQCAAFEAKGRKPTKGWEGKYKYPELVNDSGLPELPVGWCWIMLSDLPKDEPHSFNIGPFGSDLKVVDYRESGVPLIFVREIRAESFGDESTKYVTPEKALQLNSHQAQSGDLLITKMGDPPGDTSIYPSGRPKAVITADCIKLRPEPELTSSEFLRLWLRADPVRERILEETKGVAQRKLSLKRFRKIVIPLPPRLEQDEILGSIDKMFSLVEEAENTVFGVVEALSQLDQSILSKAFRGELVPQDPNDEPASDLLARIRATREAEAVSEKTAKKKTSKKKNSSKSKKTG